MTKMEAKTDTLCRCCGAVLQGSFCHVCGQKHLAGRLTVTELVSNAFAALTELDSTLWRTIRELTVNPGRVALLYIEGHRASYLNPVKFFVTILAVYFTLLAVTGTLDHLADEQVTFAPGTDMQSMSARAALAFQGILRSHFNILFFVILPLVAFAVRWQYWRARRNYAETLSFLCYVVGISCLYSSLIVGGLYFFEIYTDASRGFILTAFFAIGARTFFAMTWLRTLGGLLLTIMLYFLCAMIAGSILTGLKLAGLFG